MSTAVTVTPPTNEQVMASWSKFGLTFSAANTNLQLKAQQIIAKYPLPTKAEDVDEVVKALSQEYSAIESERKDITVKLNGVIQKLMAHEKQVQEHLVTVKEVGLELKQVAVAEAKKRQQQEASILAEKLRIQSLVDKYVSDTKRRVTEMATNDYNTALAMGAQFERLSLLSKFTKQHIFLPANSSIASDMVQYYQLHDQQKLDLTMWYDNLLKDMYSDFDIALNNKAEAQQRMKEKEEQAAKERAAEQAAKEAMQSVQQAMSAQVVAPIGRQVKSEYKITVTEANHLLICVAYATNYALHLKKYTTVKQFGSLTVSQMANYLCKAKNDGIGISIEGLVFETVEKL